MSILKKKNWFYIFFTWIQIYFFFFSFLINFNLIFLVFIAGLVNDTVVGTPLGLSSFSYIIVCVLSAYLRNITIRPDLIKDWFYFLFVITLINSINYLILFSFFSYEVEIIFYVINNLFTFLLYIPMSLIFDNYLKTIND